MKTLGVIGGIAPPSTVDYFRQLTARFRARSPDGAYPPIRRNGAVRLWRFGGRTAILNAGKRWPLPGAETIPLVLPDNIQGCSMAFNIDILAATQANTFFRQVLSTGPHAQVVVMCIPAGGEIGEEVHEGVDQVLAFLEGQGVAIIEGEESPVGPDRLVHVPAGTRHNFVNRGSGDLRLYTVYAPPEHAPGTVHKTKADADKDEADHFDPKA